jgi:hypothetical protein
VIATATFSGGLDRLVTDPANFGQTWNAVVDGGFSPAPAHLLAEKYAPQVDGVAGIVYGEVHIKGVSVPTIAFDRISGDLGLEVLEGHEPPPGEIALGTRTMRSLGLHMGETVVVESNKGSSPLRVVGRAVFPQLGQGSFFTLNLGVGAAVTSADLAPAFGEPDFPPDVDQTRYLFNGQLYNAVAFHAPTDAAASRLVDAFQRDPDIGAAILITGEQRPAAIRNYASIRSTPAVLAVVLAVLGAAMVVHTLVTALRRRRDELAMCKALGMTRRSTSAIVFWQCNALAVSALVVGVPVGIAGGRVTWRLFADDLGVSPAVSVPVLWIAFAVTATCMLVSLVGALPARAAGRTPAAVALRTE